MVQEALDHLVRLLPSHAGSFEGSQYPLPVAQTFLGEGVVDLDRIRRRLLDRADDDPKTIVTPLLIAAEQCEAASADKQRFFLDDATVRSLVFTGSKWRAGWVLVLGDNEHERTVELLKGKDFIVFTDHAGIADTIYIGDRVTSPIYFLQLMVRYGLIWGGIAPGEDHRMGHFLEEDMPGFLVITEDLPPLEYLVALGLMKLGAPAVVPQSFPFPYGTRAAAQTPEQVVQQGGRFPNLRRRYFRDQVVELPAFCNPAWASEDFEPRTLWGGDELSFFTVRPSAQARDRLTVRGRPEGSVGVLVEIADCHFTDDIALFVEGYALRALCFLKGVRSRSEEGSFRLEIADGALPTDGQIGEAIYWGIRVRFPGIEQIGVTLTYDREALGREVESIRAYQEERRQRVEAMTEENTEELCVCLECRPFSLVHTCVATPEREPMCGSRTYASIKAAALFDSADVPWKRASERGLPMRSVIRKGRVLEAARGEYEGSNDAYARMTGGKLQRVTLHSLREHPHTSCGCFQAIAFWIVEVEGIGIMLRGSKATAPDGRTWENLANQAGGKQTPGLTGVSIRYIRSPNFLRGDGGLGNTVWMDSALRGKLADAVAIGQRVGTEVEAPDIESLRRFTGR